MYNLLISLGAALGLFLAITAWLGPIAAIIPALLVFGGMYFVLARRVMQKVQVDIEQTMPMLQRREIEQARARLEDVKTRWGRWQFLLSGQIDAQIGMIDYLQMKWDDALPRLEAGKWRNWGALTCIGCIHWRKGNRDAAWPFFEKATSAAPQEAIVALIWGTLLVRADRREEALKVCDRAIQSMPKSQVLKDFQATVANKRKIETKAFPESWLQFFPEDLAAQAMIRGRRDPPPGAPTGSGTPLNRKARRER